MNQDNSNISEKEHLQPEGEDLKRKLKLRHMNMIGIGGAIGTGLFFASGSAISSAGPGGALVGFSLMGIVVYFLMTSLGEMATQIPLSGSFETYATRFVDPAFGFALGWNYWFGAAITVAAELVAASFMIRFWIPDFPPVVVSAIALGVLFLINAFSVNIFGEVEFWFAGIKVLTIIVFLICGVLMIIGVIGGHSVGFENWTLNDGIGNQAPFVGGLFGVLGVLLVAGFSFSGTEMVGLTAGESENPKEHVPKAIGAVFWRILLFYCGAIAVISFLIPFTDSHLLQGGIENVAASPFTLVFKNAGFTLAASLMNAVIITSVLSCGNTGIYLSTRMLYAMAKEGKAPKVFTKLNKRGVPMNGLYLVTAVAAVAFLGSLIGEGKIYYILYNCAGLSGFTTWLGIAICHYRFRKAYITQGRNLNDLNFKAKWYPFGPIIAFIVCLAVILFANTWVFQAEVFSWFDFITNYMLIPILVVIFFWYKKTKKTKLVPLDECDFDTINYTDETHSK